MDNEKEATVNDTHLVHNNADNISPASSQDFDETYEVYKQQDARTKDYEEARRVLRKIDLHVVPLMMGTYMLQYL